MKHIIRVRHKICRAWYWRRIRMHRMRMHELLAQWEVWKQQFPGQQMVANDYYFHNLAIQMRMRAWLFRKIRQHAV